MRQRDLALRGVIYSGIRAPCLICGWTLGRRAWLGKPWKRPNPSYRRLTGRSAANSHLPVLNPATQAVAKRRAVAIPRSQNCPISAAF